MLLSQSLITLDSFQRLLLAGATLLKRAWLGAESEVGGGVSRPWGSSGSASFLAGGGCRDWSLSVGRGPLRVEPQHQRMAAQVWCLFWWLWSSALAPGLCTAGPRLRWTRVSHPEASMTSSGSFSEVSLDPGEAKVTWGSFQYPSCGSCPLEHGLGLGWFWVV